MQRQHRRLGRARPGGAGPAWAVLLVIPLVLLAAVLLVGLSGGLVVVAGYSYFASGLPDPAKAFDDLRFEQQTSLYDRSGKVLLARLGTDRRELVTFEDIPPEMIDATTSIEDKTFWDNPGFDPFGIVSAGLDTLNGYERGASTVTMQLVRSRLLPAGANDLSVYERKVMEIIQSTRLTEAFPGIDGKRQIMQAYLNNTFYGNRSYGIAAAARGYWNKQLKDLTLAQFAALAAIPQSPTRFDLVANAHEETYTDAKGRNRTQLVVPMNSEVIRRRNFILDLMKTRSVLSGAMHTQAEYEEAKFEPLVLTPPPESTWRAPHFVWQARAELARILCGSVPDDCPQIDTGGYTVKTTLDYRMQRIVEKWLYAAAIIPNRANPRSVLRARGIPRSEWSWILGLRGHNIHNAAGAVLDYRTGEVLAYGGSASYSSKGNRRFQPQFDVLEDGWRQPGSAIKPLDYLVGIDDKTLTAATMFMDVVTNFAPKGAKAWYPTQADHLERGPVRLRSALQFSLNIPAIKAGLLIGIDHQLKRTREFGLRYQAGTQPVVSESIGTIVNHPIDMISGYGMIANGGVLMPRRTILEIDDQQGNRVWPTAAGTPPGKRVASREAAYVITDILAGNTNPRVNPFWGKWRITNGVTSGRIRPAAYKTGTTSDNRDVHAYGYLAPPSDSSLPALVAGIWMGNSDNSPNDGRLSLDTSAPLWSAILSDVSKGMPIEGFARTRPKTLVTAKVDAFSGGHPVGSRRTVTELFLPGTVPTKVARSVVTKTIDAATGLVWRSGCAGPPVTRTYVDYSRAESRFKAWQRADLAWQARAARGPGVGGGPKGARTAYLYGSGFYPFGRSWGGPFAPSRVCSLAPAPTPAPIASPPPPSAPPSAKPGNG